jgi:hypothetical protein
MLGLGESSRGLGKIKSWRKDNPTKPDSGVSGVTLKQNGIPSSYIHPLSIILFSYFLFFYNIIIFDRHV